MFAALPSPPATKALDPNLFPRLSLRHAVYADLLHFGLETANEFFEVFGVTLCDERAVGPGVVAALARTADLLRADSAALDAWAATGLDVR